MKSKMLSSEQLALTMGEYGFSYALISQVSGLDKSQVQYLFRKEEMRVRDYRNGENTVSKQVIRKLRLPTINSVKRKVA